MAKGNPARNYDDYNVDLDKAREQTKRTTYWRPKDGDSEIRIIPLLAARSFFIDAALHYRVGPDNTTSICTRDPGSMSRCAVCDEHKRLKQSASPRDQELAKDMRARQQFYSAIVDLKDVGKGVQVYQYGSQVMDQLMGLLEKDDYRTIFHPLKGRKIYVKREKTGPDPTNVKYTIAPGAREEEIAEDRWLDDAEALLKDLIKPRSYEEQLALLGFNAADEEDEDKVPQRQPVAKAPARAVPAVPVSEDEDDEEEGETSPAAPQAHGCSGCGVVLPEGAKFCLECGTKVEDAAPTQAVMVAPTASSGKGNSALRSRLAELQNPR